MLKKIFLCGLKKLTFFLLLNLLLLVESSYLQANTNYNLQCSSLEKDEFYIQKRPDMVFKIAQKWHELKNMEYSFRMDTITAHLFPTQADEIADRWYAQGDIDKAFYFDKLYLQAWNSIGPQISNKWHQRNQKTIALDYDEIAIAKCSCPFSISKIADKYYAYGLYDIAFKFDKIAVNLRPYITYFIAEKWHSRSNKLSAFYFDNITLTHPVSSNQLIEIADKYYLDYKDKDTALKFDIKSIENKFEIAHFIAQKWYQRNDLNAALQFDKVYLKHYPLSAFLVADKWYGKNKNVAFDFDKIYLNHLSSLEPPISLKWHERNEKDIALEFDKIAVPKCTDPKEISKIADKYFHYQRPDIAFEFDQIAAKQYSPFIEKIADKWYLRNSSHALHFDKLYGKDNTYLILKIADKWYDRQAIDNAYGLDLKAATLNSFLANEIANKWYDRKNTSNALHFDKLYVENKPSLAIDISSKWVKRNETDVAEIFDQIVLEESASGEQLIEIADKYHQYNSIAKAFTFDQKAVQREPYLAYKVADKWFNKGNISFALYFDKQYIENEILKLNLIVQQWDAKNISKLVLEFSKRYSRSRCDIADFIACELYNQGDENMALKFGEIYLEKKFDLSMAPARFWSDHNEDIAAKYIEIYTQLRIDIGETESNGWFDRLKNSFKKFVPGAHAIIRYVQGENEYDRIYSEIEEALQVIKDTVPIKSPIQIKKEYNEIYLTVKSHMASIIAKNWCKEKNLSIEESKKFLHDNTDMINIILSEWKKDYDYLVYMLEELFVEFEVKIANLMLQAWHSEKLTKDDIEESFEQMYSDLISKKANELISKKRPKSKKLKISQIFPNNNEIDYIYSKIIPFILDAIKNTQKYLDHPLETELQFQFSKAYPEAFLKITNSIEDKWWKRGHQNISLDFDIIYLDAWPKNKDAIDQKWAQRGFPGIVEEIEMIPMIEKLLIDANIYNVIKIFQLLNQDSPVMKRFSSRIDALNFLSPLERAIIANDLETVKNLTANLIISYMGECTPKQKKALLLASALREKEIYHYLCDKWNVPVDLKLNFAKTILNWICYLNPDNY